jgi:membrane-bound lytic murein transglycosylase B
MLAPRDRTTTVLLSAADYIERHGWCQGAMRTGDAVCAARALTIAAEHQVSIAERAGHRLARSLGTGGDARAVPGWNVPTWNDKLGRTQEEVVEALRNAAFASA